MDRLSIIHTSYLTYVMAVILLYTVLIIHVLAETKINVSVGVLVDVRSLTHHGTLFATLAEVNHRDPSINLRPIIVTVDVSDSFAVSSAMCDLISQDVVAILGVTNLSSLSTIQSYSNTYNVPFISIGSTHNYTVSSPFHIYIRPAYMGAVFEVLEMYQYKKATYLYDTDEGLMRLQDVFQFFNTKELPVDLDVRRVVEPGQVSELIQMSRFDHRQPRVMILDLTRLDIKQIIKHLNHHVGVRMHLISVTLDQLLLGPLQLNDDIEVNITGFQLVPPPDNRVDSDVTKVFPDTYQGELLSSADALIMDGIKLIRMALEISRDQEWFPQLWSSFPSGLSGSAEKCSNFIVDKKPYGSLFMDNLSKVSFYGKTGTVAFDESFKRRNIQLGVYQYRNTNRPLKLGIWSSDTGLRISTMVEDKTFTLIVNASKYSMLSPPVLLYKHQ